MNAKKLIFAVVGTRPDVIKMAPLILALREEPDCETKIISTGQHRELSRVALADFGLYADYDLDVMRASQTLSGLTARILEGLEGVFAREKPDLVLAHGDTTTAFTTALACQYQRIPIVHVEAGLRSNNIESPFPEEHNRRFIGMIAKHHFAPTEVERSNLEQEGVASDSISVVGNTVRDAIELSMKKAASSEALNTKNIVVTLHRRENNAEGLQPTLQALRSIAQNNADIKIHFPVHPSPVFHATIKEHLGDLPNVLLLPPLSYPAFLALLLRASLVITDSGGVQEEAAALSRPTIIVRDRTERHDGINQGIAVRISPQQGSLLESTAYQLLQKTANVVEAAKEPYRSVARQISEAILRRVLT